ncbi:hypothetical protein BC938DRAFT_483692 [Jimgerdemannia flammicorona]|uniref:Uncharacterized protein n=1 Tax=Jimgerdemannia flammicorona TaxID=994334 RepID=A0A433QBG1_9FUNG|nr:hypothetical protein BC938DRAFT_483692 [Jimgerdemannia flammicorona]
MVVMDVRWNTDLPVPASPMIRNLSRKSNTMTTNSPPPRPPAISPGRRNPSRSTRLSTPTTSLSRSGRPLSASVRVLGLPMILAVSSSPRLPWRSLAARTSFWTSLRQRLYRPSRTNPSRSRRVWSTG